MAQAVLTDDEEKALEMLGFFFYVMGLDTKAAKTVRALLSVCPENRWAKDMMTALAFRNGKYDAVLSLTAHRNFARGDAMSVEMGKLRARALFKTGNVQSARKLMTELTGYTG